MNYQISPERTIRVRRRKTHVKADYLFPSVTIILPFNPKMEKKDRLLFSLQRVMHDAVNLLNDKYPGEMAMLTIHKLRHVFRNLNFSTHKQSLAIFLSPVFEKVIYFNMPVKEKVIVSDTLQISDVIRNRKDSFRFHILSLGEEESKLFFHSSDAYIRFPGYPKSLRQHQFNPGDNPGKMENIHRLLLRQKNIPVLVMGNQKLIGQFKKLVHYPENIIAYVSGEFQSDSPKNIRGFGENFVENLKGIKQNFFVELIKQGADRDLATTDFSGIKNGLTSGTGRILFIHEEHLKKGNQTDGFPSQRFVSASDKFSHSKTHTDELIEIALINGVDIEPLKAESLHNSSPYLLLKNFI